MGLEVYSPIRREVIAGGGSLGLPGLINETDQSEHGDPKTNDGNS
jgi:hypothetical protein